MDLAAAVGAPIVRTVDDKECRFRLLAEQVGELLERIRNKEREAQKAMIREACQESGEKLTTDQWLEKLREIDSHGVDYMALLNGLQTGKYVDDILHAAIEGDDAACIDKIPTLERMSLALEILGLLSDDDGKGGAEGNEPTPEANATG